MESSGDAPKHCAMIFLQRNLLDIRMRIFSICSISMPPGASQTTGGSGQQSVEDEIDMRFQIGGFIQAPPLVEKKLEEQEGYGRRHDCVGKRSRRLPELAISYAFLDKGLHLSLERIDKYVVMPIDDLREP